MSSLIRTILNDTQNQQVLPTTTTLMFNTIAMNTTTSKAVKSLRVEPGPSFREPCLNYQTQKQKSNEMLNVLQESVDINGDLPQLKIYSGELPGGSGELPGGSGQLLDELMEQFSESFLSGLNLHEDQMPEK